MATDNQIRQQSNKQRAKHGYKQQVSLTPFVGFEDMFVDVKRFHAIGG
jgi:hypothetical protein